MASSSKSNRRVETTATPPSNIFYPSECKPVDPQMATAELVRRLKELATHLQSMAQMDDGSEYFPLSYHLVDDDFLTHRSADVQLLIACCIVDLLRIFAPNAPYEEPGQVKNIFLFLIKQLEGLKNAKNPSFSRCFYLLESLTFVKSFNMCLNLEEKEGQEVFNALFSQVFELVGVCQSERVVCILLELLCPILTDADLIGLPVLDIILTHLMTSAKSSKKLAHKLAKELISKCSDALEQPVQNLITEVLVEGKEYHKSLKIAPKIYDLVSELSQFAPQMLKPIWTVLQHKLRTPEESERLKCVSTLATILSDKNYTVAADQPCLWEAFLGRFKDISATIRKACVDSTMHLILNHPNLREGIFECLRQRQHDLDDSVRLDVVKTIIATAKLNADIVVENEQLLDFVKERLLDKKFKVRKEAFQGLGYIYKKYLVEEDTPAAADKAMSWIRNSILHGYVLIDQSDRFLVESIFTSCLIPWEFETDKRAETLLHLFATVDENGRKAFIEIHKNIMLFRRHTSELLNIVRKYRNAEMDDDGSKQLILRVKNVSKLFPETGKASEFLVKFCEALRKNTDMRNAMETLLDSATSCSKSNDCINMLGRKLGPAVMTNIYSNTVHILIDRISSRIIDKEVVEKLLAILRTVFKGKYSACSRFSGISFAILMEKGLVLISVLAFVFPALFNDSNILKTLLSLLLSDDEDMTTELQSRILSSLISIGKIAPIGEHHPSLNELLIPKCLEVLHGNDPELGVNAVNCLYANVNDPSARIDLFSQVLENFATTLNTIDDNNNNNQTAITCIGQIAELMPTELRDKLKSVISGPVIKGFLVNPRRTSEDCSDISDRSWCDEQDLPEITRCMLSGMKATVSWVSGRKTDITSAKKCFRMMAAFVEYGGDFINPDMPFSDSENAWLRLTAGECMLMLSTQSGVGDQFTPAQFYILGKLMIDDVLEVRRRFAEKLYKNLSSGIPTKCLPLDFMGFYALAGYERDENLKKLLRVRMIANVKQRREYIRAMMLHVPLEKAKEKVAVLTPEYMLAFAIPILAISSKLTGVDNFDELMDVRECLGFVIDGLISKDESERHSFVFYRTLVEQIKTRRNATSPEDELLNSKMYAICDLAIELIMEKSLTCKFNTFDVTEPILSLFHFARHPDPDFVNDKIYIPEEIRFDIATKVSARLKKRNSQSQSQSSGSSSVPTSQSKKRKLDRARVPEEGIDAEPMDVDVSKVQIPEPEKLVDGSDELIRAPKRTSRPTSRTDLTKRLKNSEPAPVTDSRKHKSSNDTNTGEGKTPRVEKLKETKESINYPKETGSTSTKQLRSRQLEEEKDRVVAEKPIPQASNKRKGSVKGELKENTVAAVQAKPKSSTSKGTNSSPQRKSTRLRNK